MIKIGSDFEIERDPHCWIVTQIKAGKSRKKETKGQPTQARKSTYHANLSQSFDKIIEVRVGHADTLRGVMEKLDETKAEILNAVRGLEGLP